MRKLLVVTDEFVNSEIKEAVVDAKSQLDEKTDTINELMLEKVAMAKEIDRLEAKSLLGEKTKNMTAGEKAYITKFFEGAGVEEINQRLDEAVRAYDNDMTRKKEELISEETETEIPVVESSDEPEIILNEGVNEDEDMMDVFVNQINRSHTTR
jgi:hypothetical protein